MQTETRSRLRARLIRLGAASALVTAVLAGCAQPGTTTPGASGSTTPTGGAPTATTPPVPNATDATGCGLDLKVTEAASGQTVCLHPGGVITVALHGAPGLLWRPVTVAGDALTETAVASPPAGVAVTTHAYAAAHAGTATLQSARSLCPPAKPGSAACQAMQAFTLTVEVR